MEARARRRVLALAALQAGDAIACAIPLEIIRRDLERLGVPDSIRPVIPAAKAASAVGLAVGLRRPRLGLLTSLSLVAYFVLAIGAHVRLRDEAWRYVAAVGMMGIVLQTLRSFRQEL